MAFYKAANAPGSNPRPPAVIAVADEKRGFPVLFSPVGEVVPECLFNRGGKFNVVRLFFVSLALPINNADPLQIFSSSYDAIFLTMLMLVCIAAGLTYVAAVVKDRATHSVTRSAAFILLIIGNLISMGTDIITGVISAVIYVAGIILLSISAKNTF